MRKHLDQFNRTLIDFVNGPIFTATLLKVAAQRHVLVLGSHHLLTDGMSMLNVVNELNAGYVARDAARQRRWNCRCRTATLFAGTTIRDRRPR